LTRFSLPKKTGTGLGLAVVHQIITQHGASLEVETDPWPGLQFHNHIPARSGSRDMKKKNHPAGR